MVNGSWLKAYASRLVAQDHEKLALGPGAWGTQRQICVSWNHEPWSMSLEPWTINNRWINKLFDYILLVLAIRHYPLNVPYHPCKKPQENPNKIETKSQNKSKTSGTWDIQIPIFSKFLMSHSCPILTKIIFPQDLPIFSWLCEAFLHNKMNKYGLLQVRTSINHEDVKFWCLK